MKAKKKSSVGKLAKTKAAKKKVKKKDVTDPAMKDEMKKKAKMRSLFSVKFLIK